METQYSKNRYCQTMVPC